jgi:hypothetical protein
LLGERAAQDAGADGAVLERGRVVVESDERREFLLRLGDQGTDRGDAGGIDVLRHAARHDDVAHQPMAESGIGRAQHALAQHAAMRQHHRERRVVANGADIAEMIGNALQLRHQSAQPHCPRRRFDAQRRFRRARESDCIGDGAVARDAAGELRRALERRARHQAFDAFMDIAEALFQTHHSLAAGGEAEMTRLDDPGMHRADRNLVQMFALGGEKIVRFRMVEPRAPVERILGIQPIEVADRALQADCRRMQAAERREAPRRAIETQHGDDFCRRVEHRHMHRIALSPKPEQA